MLRAVGLGVDGSPWQFSEGVEVVYESRGEECPIHEEKGWRQVFEDARHFDFGLF